MPLIYDAHKAAPQKPPRDAVYVGRRARNYPESPWGNPFKVDVDGTLEEVIAKFRAYALDRWYRDPNWLEPLRGKPLLCWCQSPSDPDPAPCHAEVLMELASLPADTREHINNHPGVVPPGCMSPMPTPEGPWETWFYCGRCIRMRAFETDPYPSAAYRAAWAAGWEIDPDHGWCCPAHALEDEELS